MSLRYFGNELYNRAPNTVIAFFYEIVLGLCLLRNAEHSVFHVLDVFWFLFCVPLYHQYLAPYAVLSFKYI